MPCRDASRLFVGTEQETPACTLREIGYVNGTSVPWAAQPPGYATHWWPADIGAGGQTRAEDESRYDEASCVGMLRKKEQALPVQKHDY